MAEGEGFEPSEGCPSHAFQACRFGRSRTPPGWTNSMRSSVGRISGPAIISVTAISPSEVVTGSCATDAREPGQDRKVAAFIGIVCVPQIAWSSPQSARCHRRVAPRSRRDLPSNSMQILPSLPQRPGRGHLSEQAARRMRAVRGCRVRRRSLRSLLSGHSTSNRRRCRPRRRSRGWRSSGTAMHR